MFLFGVVKQFCRLGIWSHTYGSVLPYSWICMAEISRGYRLPYLTWLEQGSIGVPIHLLVSVTFSNRCTLFFFRKECPLCKAVLEDHNTAKLVSALLSYYVFLFSENILRSCYRLVYIILVWYCTGTCPTVPSSWGTARIPVRMDRFWFFFVRFRSRRAKIKKI